MMQSRCRTLLCRGLLAGALGFAFLAAGAGSAVHAQEDDPSDNAFTRFERKVWNGIVRGLGLKGDEPPIDYRERSPLVVPPSRDLPPPQAHAAPRDPAWPVDPDVKRAKEQAAAKKKKGRMFVEDEERSRPLTPEELNPPGTGRTTTASTTTGSTAPERQGNRLSPSELGYSGGLFSWEGFGFGARKPEVGTFTQEPARTDLTAPPSGYQTPSVAQPYGTTPRIEYGQAQAHDPASGQ